MTTSSSPPASRALARARGQAAHVPPPNPLRVSLAHHVPDLHLHALRLCRHDAVARDLVQDTVERALRFEAQFDPSSNLRAWLHCILTSVFLTRCRRQRRERRALERLIQDPCAWTMPDALTGAHGLSQPAARALAALPEHFRRAVQLVDVAELSYRDAATLLGVPVGTVMSRLHRGRRMLAEVWSPGDRAPRRHVSVRRAA